MLLFILFYTSVTALFASSLAIVLLNANSVSNFWSNLPYVLLIPPPKKSVLKCESKMFYLVLKYFIIWLLTEQETKKEHPWGMLHFEHISVPTEITNISNQPYKPPLSACSVYPSHLPWLPRYQHGTQSCSPCTQKIWPLSLAPVHCIRLWLRFGVEACSSWNACSPRMSIGTDCQWPERCFATSFYSTSCFEFGVAPVSFCLAPPLAVSALAPSKTVRKKELMCLVTLFLSFLFFFFPLFCRFFIVAPTLN